MVEIAAIFPYIQKVRSRRVHAIFRQNATFFAPVRRLGVHIEDTELASFVKLPSGSWRAVVRRKSRYISETFKRKEDARTWALNAERQIDCGEAPRTSKVGKLKTFGSLIDLHVADMKEVGKAPGRSKAFTLDMLKAELGKLKLDEIDRERIITFGRDRAKSGAGPVTVGMDIGVIKLVMQHCAAVHGIDAKVEPIDLGRYALKRLGLVGKSNERDRRPADDELDKLMEHWDGNDRQLIPMSRILKFAIATAMRQEEICKVTWPDFNERTKMLMIRDRKDPRAKKGNDQRIPLLAVSGYDAMALIDEQRSLRANHDERIFPYNPKSISANFTRTCQELAIEDLHFHDLRHEGTSRLFEAGYRVEQVALVTGHKDWKMLRRYTHLKPESLHKLANHPVA